MCDCAREEGQLIGDALKYGIGNAYLAVNCNYKTLGDSGYLRSAIGRDVGTRPNFR